MKQTVIIGAGVAGLSCGIHCLNAGRRVVILERGEAPGGLLGTWKRGEYRIDNCMHWLNGTAPGSDLHRMWETLGMLDDPPRLRRDPFFYTSEWRGMSFGMGRDAADTRRRMLLLSPADRREITRLMNAVDAVADYLRAQRAEGGLRGRWERGTAAWGALGPAVVYAPITLDKLRERFCHPLLRCLLGDFIGGSFSALAWIAAYAAFVAGDADLPLGGSEEAARRMAARFDSMGGEMRLSTPVRRVRLSGTRAVGVVTEAGEVIEADDVVYTGEPGTLFGRLLPRALCPAAWRRLDRRADEMRFSALQAAFSVPAGSVPFRGTMICDLPRGVSWPRALPPLPRTTASADRVPGASPPGERIALRLYTDAENYAPPGRWLLQVLRFIPAPEARAWVALAQSGTEYRRAKSLFSATMSEAIDRLFDLGGHVTTVDVWTPATYRRYCGTSDGAFLGPALTPRAWTYRLPSALPGLSNVWLASQWQKAPGGLPTAAAAGRRAALLLTAADAKAGQTAALTDPAPSPKGR